MGIRFKKYDLGDSGIPDFDWVGYSSTDFRHRVKDDDYYQLKAVYERKIPVGSLTKENSPGSMMIISEIYPVKLTDTTAVVMVVTETGYSFKLDLKKDKFLIEYFYNEPWSFSNVVDFVKNCAVQYAHEIKDLQIPVVFNMNRQPDIDKAVQLNVKDNLLKQLDLPIQEKTLYKSKIISANNGGFNVEVRGLMCFLPVSQSSIMIPRSVSRAEALKMLESHIGEHIDVVVYARGRNDSLIVSNREYISMCVKEAKENIQPSDDIMYQGKITGVTYFGIFVECESSEHILPSGQPIRFSGLLHTSVMSDELYEQLQNNQLFVGEQIGVYINSIADNDKYNLSDMKFAEAEKMSVKREEEKAKRKELEAQQENAN